MLRNIASRVVGSSGVAVMRMSSGASVQTCAVRWNTENAAATSGKIEDLANMYSQLTLKEVTQLQKLIFKKLGHSDDFYEQALLKGLGGGGGGGMVMTAMPAGAMPAVAAPAADAAPAEEVKETKKKVEKNTFDVKLAKFPPEIKIKLIKELRTVTNLPLKDAKDAIDKCPGLVQTNMGKDDAEKLKKLFEALGATVELL